VLTTAPDSPPSGKPAGPAAPAAPVRAPGDAPKEGPKKPPAAKEEPKKNAAVVIPPALQDVPVLQDPDLHVLRDPPGRDQAKTLATTDNSNTQFAILALWAAQRYDVPMGRTMNLVVRRFHKATTRLRRTCRAL
jgi:hypothetical protein